MKTIGVAAFSCIVGMICGIGASRSIMVREKLGEICGHGHPLALVRGIAIYEDDVDRTLREFDYLNDIERTGAADIERRPALNRLIVNAAVRALAARERIPVATVTREYNLIRSQFRDTQTWTAALRGSGLFSFSLWLRLKDDLRARDWISRRIANQLIVTEEEARKFYQDHSERFFVPERLRVSHLFLAAPVESPPEVIEAKRKAIQAFSMRLAAGEDFAVLAAQNSEDEATKFNGGDLGYFTASRMPSDFVAAANQLREGELSQPMQTRIGFHILKLAEIASSRQRSFDEARAEIFTELANQKRIEAIKKLTAEVASVASQLPRF